MSQEQEQLGEAHCPRFARTMTGTVGKLTTPCNVAAGYIEPTAPESRPSGQADHKRFRKDHVHTVEDCKEHCVTDNPDKRAIPEKRGGDDSKKQEFLSERRDDAEEKGSGEQRQGTQLPPVA